MDAQDQEQHKSANDLRENTFVLGTMGGTGITAVILVLAILFLLWWTHAHPKTTPGELKTPSRQDGKPKGTP